MLRAVVRMAAEVAAQPVRWLWKDQLALGKIAVVAGAANVGKSLLVTGDVAARVSVGAAWTEGSPCPAGDARPCLKIRRAVTSRRRPACFVLAPQRLFRLSRSVAAPRIRGISEPPQGATSFQTERRHRLRVVAGRLEALDELGQLVGDLATVHKSLHFIDL